MKNPTSPWRAGRSALLAALVAMLAAGCASIGRSDEQVVAQRAQARWDALVERDWKEAYPYMTPGYRAIVPLKRFGSQFSGPVQWESAKVHGAKCEEARCTVRVEVGYRLALPGQGGMSSTFFDETWVREEGQWFKFEAP